MSVSTAAGENESGLIGSAKNALGSKLDAFLNLPDAPNKKWQRVALHIIFDLGLLLLVFMMASIMIGGFHTIPFSAANITALANGFANPSLMNVMSMPMIAGGAAVGLSWLIQDCLPRKSHRGVSKVMAVATPLLIIGAAAALILCGGKISAGAGLHNYHFSFTKAMTGSYFYVGLLLLPLGFFAAAKGGDAFQRRIPVISRRESSHTTRARRQRGLSSQQARHRLESERGRHRLELERSLDDEMSLQSRHGQGSDS